MPAATPETYVPAARRGSGQGAHPGFGAVHFGTKQGSSIPPSEQDLPQWLGMRAGTSDVGLPRRPVPPPVGSYEPRSGLALHSSSFVVSHSKACAGHYRWKQSGKYRDVPRIARMPTLPAPKLEMIPTHVSSEKSLRSVIQRLTVNFPREQGARVGRRWSVPSERRAASGWEQGWRRSRGDEMIIVSQGS